MGAQSGRPINLGGTQLGQALSAQMGGPPGSKGTAAMPPPPQNMVGPDPRQRANPGMAAREADFRNRQPQQPTRPHGSGNQQSGGNPSPRELSVADVLRRQQAYFGRG